MEEEIKTKFIEISDLLDNIRWDISEVTQKTEELEYDIKERDNNSIKDIDNLKRELKRDGLYSIQLEEFLEDYMKYYNK